MDVKKNTTVTISIELTEQEAMQLHSGLNELGRMLPSGSGMPQPVVHLMHRLDNVIERVG